MKNNMNITIIIALLLGFSITASLLILEKRKNIGLKKKLSNVSEKYLTKNGATRFYGDGELLNYNLKSFDGGKRWYVVEFGEDWEVNIRGDVEDIYPGLIAELEANERLMDYVIENGSIGSRGSITDEEMKILNHAKITVTYKDNIDE